MADKLIFERGLLLDILFYPVSVNPPLPHIHSCPIRRMDNGPKFYRDLVSPHRVNKIMKTQLLRCPWLNSASYGKPHAWVWRYMYRFINVTDVYRFPTPILLLPSLCNCTLDFIHPSAFLYSFLATCSGAWYTSLLVVDRERGCVFRVVGWQKHELLQTVWSYGRQLKQKKRRALQINPKYYCICIHFV